MAEILDEDPSLTEEDSGGRLTPGFAYGARWSTGRSVDVAWESRSTDPGPSMGGSARGGTGGRLGHQGEPGERSHVRMLSVRYMVVERYIHGPGPIYERAGERGRILPDGLRYVESWVVADEELDCCFQLMETDDPSLFDAWIESWRDLATFEVYPVITSAEAAGRVGVEWGRRA
jgi:hypothetical protein